MRRHTRKYVPAFDSMESRQLLSTIPASIQPTSPTTAFISWSKISGATGYTIREVINNAWQNIAVLPSTSSNITIPNLNPGQGYTFDILAKNKPAYISNNLNVVTPVPAPGAFTLYAGPNGPTAINLAWTPSSYASSYSIYIYSGGQWVSIFGTGNTTATVPNLAPNTTYYFIVNANDSSGSTTSNEVAVTTALPTPGAFTLYASPNGPNAINLGWTQSVYADHYDVFMVVNNQWSYVITTSGTSTTVGNLAPNTTYTFVVNSLNGYGNNQSNIVSSTTTLPSIQTVHPVFDDPTNSTEIGWHYVLGPDSLYLTNPVATDVRQHALGDCWLEAALIQIATRNPTAIKNMFTDLGYFIEGGTIVHCYNVKLYDINNQPHQITVDNEFAMNSSGYYLGNGNESGQIWACLIEKAYAIAASQQWVMISSPSHNDYDCLNIGRSSWAFQAFTGHYATENMMTGNPSIDAAAVDYYFNNGCYVVLGTVNPVNSHIDGSHIYSLQSDSAGTYVLDNPWNIPDGTYYGSFFALDGTSISQNFADYEICAI